MSSTEDSEPGRTAQWRRCVMSNTNSSRDSARDSVDLCHCLSVVGRLSTSAVGWRTQTARRQRAAVQPVPSDSDAEG